MTLITAAANPDFVVQVSDRRLSTSAGPVAEEQTKAIHLHLPHADLLIGYTGLAKVYDDPMSALLMQMLMESAEVGDFAPLETAAHFRVELTRLFKSRRIRSYPPSARRLTVMMTGYNRAERDHPRLIHGLFTNFEHWGERDDIEAWDEFTFTRFSIKQGENWPTLVQRIGEYGALSADDVESMLRPLLAPNKPASAVRSKLALQLPQQASRFATIGPDANAAVLQPNGAVEWSFTSSSPSWVFHGGNVVWATPSAQYMLRDLQVSQVDAAGNAAQNATPLVVPQVPPGRPCPCRSGLRYRQCHGRNGRDGKGPAAGRPPLD